MRVSAICVAHVWKNMNVFAASVCMAVYDEQTTVNVTLTMSLPLRYSMPIGVSVRTNASNFISYLFTHTHTRPTCSVRHTDSTVCLQSTMAPVLYI